MVGLRSCEVDVPFVLELSTDTFLYFDSCAFLSFFFFFNKYHASILKSIRVKNIHVNVEFTYLKTKEVYISLAEFSHYFPAY